MGPRLTLTLLFSHVCSWLRWSEAGRSDGGRPGAGARRGQLVFWVGIVSVHCFRAGGRRRRNENMKITTTNEGLCTCGPYLCYLCDLLWIKWFWGSVVFVELLLLLFMPFWLILLWLFFVFVINTRSLLFFVLFFAGPVRHCTNQNYCLKANKKFPNVRLVGFLLVGLICAMCIFLMITFLCDVLIHFSLTWVLFECFPVFFSLQSLLWAKAVCCRCDQQGAAAP